MILGKTKARKLTKQVKKLVKKHGGEAVSAYFDGLIANVTAKRARAKTHKASVVTVTEPKKAKRAKAAKPTEIAPSA